MRTGDAVSTSRGNPGAGPVLRWAGSKRRALPSLLDASPAKFSRYYEPFAGSAVLFFGLNPPKATISDFNPHVINLYKNLAKDPIAISTKISSMPVSADYYYHVRKQFDPNDDSLENSAQFLYLNRCCFNGIFRTDKNGRFNVPFGSRVGKMPTLDALIAASRRFKRTTMRTADYRTVLESVEANDFVYLDPPYFESTRNPRGEYGYGSFRHSDLIEFVEVAQSLSNRGANVLISYKADPSLTSMLAGWRFNSTLVTRFIAAQAQQRRAAVELLISNY